MSAMARATAPERADPRQDPRYRRVVAKLDADSRRLKQHPTARQKAIEPAKAAKGPPNEKAAGARAQQVDKLDDAKAPKPETKSFLATLQAEIAKAMPKNLGDTEKFMQGSSAEAMKGSLKGNVAQQKDASTGDMKSASQAAPNEAAAPAKQVTPIALEAPTPAPTVDGADAMPIPKPDAEVSLQASKTEVQGQLDQERLSEVRLKRANDPRFSSVLTAQGAVSKQADSAPGQYRGKEAGVLGQAAAKAMDVARRGAGLLLGVKGGNKAKVQSRQEQQKAKEELELKDFSDFVVKTFQGAKKAVDDRLAALDTKVNELFDQGIEGALASMKEFVDGKLLRYKLERYLGVPWGAALWLKDQFLELPKEVDAFYEAGRKQFTNTMNALAVKVASLVENELAAAKKDVKGAQAQIAARQAKLSPGVQARGATLQAEFNDKFAELESGIEDKKQQLAEGLAQKYKEAFDKADESLKAIQDENKGLVSKAKEKIGEVIKALKEFKERLDGILKKGANAVQIILDDPIQFLKYLLSAIKLGFTQFADNIDTHLKAGLIKWMFGSLTKLGIEPPKDLSMGQILKLVLGVLGITYARMREKAVKLLGPTAVSAIEKVAEYIQALITGGPAALWEKVKDDLGNLKEMVVDAIQDWLITTIVKKAVAKVVSMFNPVGAIVQAILLIVDVVTFVVEKAMQLLDFVEAVVNSLYHIATGAIGTAANWIEQALGRMVPILIGFLGQLLGLGGITEKIKEFIKKIQAKVDKAIDKVIAKVVALVKRLGGAVKAGVKRLLEWWKKKKPFSGGGESHTLLFEGGKDSPQLMVHSASKEPKEFIQEYAPKGVVPPEATALLKDIKTLQTAVQKAQKKDPPDEAVIEQKDKELTDKFNDLGELLATLLDRSEDEGSEKNPVPADYPKRRASAYKNIYVGPATDQYIKQDWLKTAAAAATPARARQLLLGFEPKLKKETTFTAWSGAVTVFRPSGGANPSIPGGPVGLAPEIAGLAPGKVLIYDIKGKTGGGGKINKVFKPFGFRPGKEGLDGDHVIERQLGGPDELWNLWPLDSSENRSSGSTVKSISVSYKGQPENIHKVREKRKKKKNTLHILIKSVKGGT
jgi:hypothetical protein